MGACLGSFKNSKKRKRHFQFQRCIYHTNEDKVEIDFLVSDEEPDEINNEGATENYSIWTMSGRMPPMLMKGRKQGKSGFCRLDKQNENNEEYFFLQDDASDDKDETQLMPLDAHTLLASRALQKRKISCSSSTPPSSIDLEWENEGILASTSFHRKRLPSCNLEEGSSESGVGGTSPESLEWDPCDQSITDLETEQLICEIERLTSRALNETGDWTNR